MARKSQTSNKSHPHQAYLDQYSINTELPPFLEMGASGPGVKTLQILLLLEGFRGPKSSPLVADGDFGSVTRDGVRWLQRHRLGFKGRDVDGEFGPGTRAAYEGLTGFDVNTIPFGSNGDGDDPATEWAYDSGIQQISWPPSDEDDWRTPLGWKPMEGDGW